MDGRLGLVGLGVMGRNIALSLARHGFAVSGFDLDGGRRTAAAAAFAGSSAAAAESIDGVVRALERPRRILLMVPAGALVGPADPHPDELARVGAAVRNVGDRQEVTRTRRRRRLRVGVPSEPVSEIRRRGIFRESHHPAELERAAELGSTRVPRFTATWHRFRRVVFSDSRNQR